MALPTLTFFLILLSFITKTYAQFQFLHSVCSNITYTPNSTYQSNLETVLNSLSSNTRTTTTTNGYYNTTAGQNPDKAEVIVLCRGDIPLQTCHLCIRDSAATLPVTCPSSKQAFGVTDNCIIFFSHNFTSQIIRRRPLWALWSDHINVHNITGFNNSLTSLMSTLQTQASLGNSDLKYATGKTEIDRLHGNVKRGLNSSNTTIYGLVQCKPDLSRIECSGCVEHLFSLFPTSFVTSAFTAPAARLVCPSCNVRYSIDSFYGNVADVGPPQPQFPAPPTSNRRNNIVPGKHQGFCFFCFKNISRAN